MFTMANPVTVPIIASDAAIDTVNNVANGGKQSSSSVINDYGLSADDYRFLFRIAFDNLSNLNASQNSYDDKIRQENYAFNSSEALLQREFESAEARINREFQQNSAREAMQFNAEQAQIQRDWQEQMANTSYQRMVQDLRAAGLNPMLAYAKGGATTPSGAAGSGVSASGSSARGTSANSGYSLSNRQMMNSVTSVFSNLLDFISTREKTSYSFVTDFMKALGNFWFL